MSIIALKAYAEEHF